MRHGKMHSLTTNAQNIYILRRKGDFHEGYMYQVGH